MQKEMARYEVEMGINNCLLVRDTHNSDLTSLTKHALSFLEQQSTGQCARTLIVSDIDADEMVCEMFYNNIQQIINSDSVQRLICIGDDLMAHSTLFHHPNAHFFRTTYEFLDSELIDSFHNEAILLKVAPLFKPNKIERRLQQLAHDTVMEINFDAMFHNIDYFRMKLEPSTKLMCMVKASAYGSGSVEVAQAMEHYGVDYLAVAFVNEGCELREAGIRMPIMVLDPMVSSINHLFQYQLEPEVCSFRMLRKLIKEAQMRKLKRYPIHIKFDTGMHRAGFELKDMEMLLSTLKKYDCVEVVSAFSHLAAADELSADMDAFTLQQIKVFTQCTQQLEQALGRTVIKHILNTAGIDRFTQYQFDMVRLGIGLWGMNCTNQDKLRNVSSLSTRIMQIRHLEPGETVGYGRKGVITAPTDIALLPIGYADGLDRRLGNNVGCLFYENQSLPIVGNICMDLTMVDVTGLNVREGDKVVIFNDEHPLSDIAKMLGTIPYEVLTSISPRVRRVYYRV
ncbi:MAG: alanine racemase [Bacteroidales bacterium]|nr:alanine racemase [Bacteroidales bacterium]